jgi:acetyl-CoA carboxylase carboxyltransferase component
VTVPDNPHEPTASQEPHRAGHRRDARPGEGRVIPLSRNADRQRQATAPKTMAAVRAATRQLHADIVAGRADGVARQHALGKRTARERIDALLDPDSFTEVQLYRRHRASTFGMAGNRPHTDGVVAGSGTIEGRRVFVYAQDFTIFGGSLGEAHAAKIHKVMDLAMATGSPLIGLNDSGGARLQEGVLSLHGYGGIFRRQVAASGVIPQISVVLGPCAGGAAYSPALADVVFMVRETAKMYLTGPDVVAAVCGQRVTHEELGGADMHGSKSGVATFVCDDEDLCLDEVRRLVAMLPSNYLDLPPQRPTCGAEQDDDRPFADLVPFDAKHPYDMREVIAELVDDEDFFEFHEGWSANVICALGHIDGYLTGMVGNQPLVLAGVLDSDASQKAARFVRFCDAFGIPLVTLVDVPGFLPGLDQEQAGVIRHGAQLLHAYCEATVPRVQVILRKAYGGAYIVMDSRSIGSDICLAWPTNEIAVLGAEPAVNVLYRKDLAAAEDPGTLREELIAQYTEEFLHPSYAAERGLIDDVIDPNQTRGAVARALAMLRGKRVSAPHRKHGNQPG